MGVKAKVSYWLKLTAACCTEHVKMIVLTIYIDIYKYSMEWNRIESMDGWMDVEG